MLILHPHLSVMAKLHLPVCRVLPIMHVLHIEVPLPLFNCCRPRPSRERTLPVRATQIGRHPPRALAQVVTDPSHTMAPVCRTFPSFAACSAPSCFCRAIQGVAGKRPISSQPALFIDVPMFCMGPPVLYGHFWLQGRQQPT